MKNYLFLFIAIFLLSACEKTNEDKIRASFKDYVEKNFDDPSALKEIVAIELVDTVSTIKLKKSLTDFYLLFDSVKTLQKKKSDSFISFMKKQSTISKLLEKKISSNSMFMELYKDNMELAEKKLDILKSGKNIDIKEEYEELMSFQDTTYYRYSLSYRIKDIDGLKLKKIYAACDTLYSNILFSNEDFNNITSYMADVELFILDNKRTTDEIYIKQIQLIDSMVSILKDEYGISVDD